MVALKTPFLTKKMSQSFLRFSLFGSQGSESQEIMYPGLPLPTLFQRKGGRGLRLFGVCAFNWRNMVY